MTFFSSFFRAACVVALLCVASAGMSHSLQRSLYAQNPADTVRGWRTGGQFALSLTNVGFSNWVAGGQNTLALAAQLTAFANHRSNDLMDNWDTALDASIGGASIENAPFRKSVDQLILVSKYSHKLSGESPFGYSALLDFRTQFAAGFDFAKDSRFVSSFFAPANLILATGIDYKPSDNFALFLSPIGGRITIVGNTELSARGDYGVVPGQATLVDLGASFNLFWKQPIMENVTFQTRLNLFRSYNANTNVARMQYVVVNWETNTLFKVNKFLNVGFETQFIFDERVRTPVVGQFRNTLALNFLLPL
jgi:hypothetical protein